MKNRLPLTIALLGLTAFISTGFAAPAAENWDNHCAKCHGADGKGQTKVGRKLKAKDYTDAVIQAAMTDEEMIKAIAEGTVDAKGKETMKPFKDELSSDEIKDLVAYVRALREMSYA